MGGGWFPPLVYDFTGRPGSLRLPKMNLGHLNYFCSSWSWSRKVWYFRQLQSTRSQVQFTPMFEKVCGPKRPGRMAVMRPAGVTSVVNEESNAHRQWSKHGLHYVFETQSRHQEKSKTGTIGPHKKEFCPPDFLFGGGAGKWVWKKLKVAHLSCEILLFWLWQFVLIHVTWSRHQSALLQSWVF